MESMDILFYLTLWVDVLQATCTITLWVYLHAHVNVNSEKIYFVTGNPV